MLAVCQQTGNRFDQNIEVSANRHQPHLHLAYVLSAEIAHVIRQIGGRNRAEFAVSAANLLI